MNDMQREVLAANGPDLKDIIVTESLLGTMYFRKIFDQEIIELIRAQRTPTEKISMVLDYLPRRGPNAFDNFVLVLHENYSWLAIMLQTSIDNRQKKMQLLREKMEQESEKVQSENLKSETSQMDILPTSPRKTTEISVFDEDIRTKVSSFVQRQFGQIRRIANTDKKMIERFMTEWLQMERKRLKAFFAKSETPGNNYALQHPDVKECLLNLHRKLAPFNQQKEAARSVASTTGQDDEDDVFIPDNISFEMISDEIDEVIVGLQGFENKLNQCKDYFGNRKTDLAVQVHNLMSGFREKENELVKERQKIEDVLVELYELSTKSNKLQQSISTQETEIIHLKQLINKLRGENVLLINEITALERNNIVHMEKEKTLEDLKQTKQDMETLMKIITQENSDLKQQMNRGAGRFGNRGYQGRRQIVAPANGVSQRKAAPKRKPTNYNSMLK